MESATTIQSCELPEVASDIDTAIDRLSADGFIAYPTETVWGLGACADRTLAVDRLFAWKGRRGDHPVAVLVSSVEVALELGCSLDEDARRLARAFWPGPLMIVVPCEKSFAAGIAGPTGSIGLRCSDHPIVQAFVERVEEAGLGPLTSTSLNRTGQAPATTVDSAAGTIRDAAQGGFESPMLFATLDSGIPCDAGGGPPSSIVDCTGALPRILRIGAIEASSLEKVWVQ